MKRKRLLDSFALLVYLNKEKGFQKVREILSMAQAAGQEVLMNEINVGEVYYILARKQGREEAEFFLDTILASLPITPVANTFEDIIDAARIKAEYPISFADCFAAALSKKRNAMLVTGEPEFKKIENLVAIDWLDS